MNLVISVFAMITFTNCDWVEILQDPVELEKVTKNIDFTTYILTTTSTTTQTPIFANPKTTERKKSHIKRVTVNMQRSPVVTVSSIKNVSTESAKKEVYDKTALNNYNDANYENDTNAEEIDEDVFDDDEETEDDEEEYINGPNENPEDGYTYANFVPYMSVIQSILMKNTHNTKKSKVDVLKHLKDHLLSEIQNRISNLWNSKPSKPREAREYKEDSHVDFPSNEGALMTIGFLTFAVFLIKLVLQLIHAIGNKTDDNGTTTTTIIGRKRRSAELNQEAIKILNYIDIYRFKTLNF